MYKIDFNIYLFEQKKNNNNNQRKRNIQLKKHLIKEIYKIYLKLKIVQLKQGDVHPQDGNHSHRLRSLQCILYCFVVPPNYNCLEQLKPHFRFLH